MEEIFQQAMFCNALNAYQRQYMIDCVNQQSTPVMCKWNVTIKYRGPTNNKWINLTLSTKQYWSIIM